MRSRLLKTTVLAAAAGAMWTHMPQLTLRLNIGRRLSLKCFFLGHEIGYCCTNDGCPPSMRAVMSLSLFVTASR